MFSTNMFRCSQSYKNDENQSFHLNILWQILYQIRHKCMSYKQKIILLYKLLSVIVFIQSLFCWVRARISVALFGQFYYFLKIIIPQFVFFQIIQFIILSEIKMDKVRESEFILKGLDCLQNYQNIVQCYLGQNNLLVLHDQNTIYIQISLFNCIESIRFQKILPINLIHTYNCTKYLKIKQNQIIHKSTFQDNSLKNINQYFPQILIYLPQNIYIEIQAIPIQQNQTYKTCKIYKQSIYFNNIFVILIQIYILKIQISLLSIYTVLTNRNMSRLSNTFTKHKKDNYSLDIKGVYKTGMQTPFGKKKDNDSHPYFFKLKTQTQTQVAQNTSMQLSDKQIGHKQKRRFSLNKAFKMNNSVGIENHLSKQKIKRINQLMSQNKFDQCLQIIRQLLIRQENQFIKNRLFWLNAICLQKVGKIKQAEHFLTRLLNEEQDNYQALIQRASIRYNLGAKELSVRDFKYAIYVNPKKQQAYVQLCNMFLGEGENKQAYNIVHAAIEKGVQSIQIFLNIIQMLLTDRNISQSSQKKAQFYIQKLTKNIGKNTKNSADFQYLQALQFQKKQKYTQACIYYQQCLKYNNSTYSVTKSLQRLILIKILQRDYYSAYHTVNRYKILNIQAKIIQPYIMFLQGVILIMKKKFNDGIKVFDILLEVIKNNSITEKNQIHLQMLFKQFSQSKGIKEKQKNSKDNKEKQKQKQKQKDKDPRDKQKEKQKGKILAFSHIHHKCKQAITALMLKFNSYASFKLGNHQKCIQYYQKLVDFGMDECSSYNLLLAEGIIAVQKKKNFQLGMQKFEQARYVYPCKVQPSIYIAMTVIYRDLCISGMNLNPNNQSQSLTSAIIHAMQELNQAHQTINNSSSNLLFHRCILNLYMQEWDAAMNDINLCIQKAEQNEPKYFYLRGLCYAVVKDLKKAINQYSISLSLDPEYIKSLLQRSKCHFLLGQTQSGFSDLKQYMYKNQNDYFVHKWIGDLLYQGKSYSDAYKAYSQIDQSLMFQAEIMKCKCLIRTTDLNKVSDCLTKLSKLEQCNQNMLQVDILAVTLLKQLIKPHQIKDTTTKIKKLNSLLQENCVGYIFGLIDCMNLLGIATFDAGRYEQAYESFLLVLQLYSTLAQKNKSQLKSDCSEQGLSLTLQDIYLNITFSLIGMKDFDSAARIIGCQLISCTATQKCESRITSVLQKYSKQESNGETIIIQPDFPKNQKIKLKQFILKMKYVKIKFCPVFSLFHTCVEDLYSKSVTHKMIKDLKPSYIDNMPEGPWIKRNQHGVIFTDQAFQNSISSDFLSSMRAKQSSDVSQQASRRIEHDDEDDQIRKRQQFKKKMLLDKQIERKLDKIIKKTNQ